MKLNVEEINSLPEKNRFKYLREAKKALIKVKTSSEISSDVMKFPTSFLINSKSIVKNEGNRPFFADDITKLHVKVVANTANWIDSQLDMLLPDCWQKSINERKGFIPHLHDHIRSLDAKVGDVTDIYGQDVMIRDLGIDKDGLTQVLIFESDIKKSYNEKIFNQYKDGSVNQHSIGLRYIDMVLAINDPNDPDHFKNWEMYINKAINPDLAIQFGYFWIVKEMKLIENSAVLFGANELTPTLETRSNSNLLQAVGENPPQESNTEPPSKALNFEKLTNILDDLKF